MYFNGSIKRLYVGPGGLLIRNDVRTQNDDLVSELFSLVPLIVWLMQISKFFDYRANANNSKESWNLSAPWVNHGGALVSSAPGNYA